MVTDTDSFDRHQQTNNSYYHATITLIPKPNEDIKNKNADPPLKICLLFYSEYLYLYIIHDICHDICITFNYKTSRENIGEKSL